LVENFKMTEVSNNHRSPIKAAVIQMVSTADLDENFKQIVRLMDQLTIDPVRLVILPENCLMFSAVQFLELAKNTVKQSIILNFFSNQAKKHSCYLVAGTIPVLASKTNKVFSTCVIFSPLGEEVARYQKIHLFDVDVEDSVGRYRESETIEAGEKIVSFDMQGIRVGVSICYDLRFPELYRHLSDQGCEVFVLPSAFTFQTGSLHWEVLLRARAIENQCFMLAANQGGTHLSVGGKPRETYGHSMIVDPQGKIVTSLERGEGLCIAELDVGGLQKVRKQMPVLKHRKI